MRCPQNQCDGGGWLYVNREDGTRAASRCACLEARIAADKEAKSKPVKRKRSDKPKPKAQAALGIAPAPWRPL